MPDELPELNKHLYVIHCSQGRADECKDQSPPVSAIVVENIVSEEQTTFAAFRIAELRGLPAASPEHQLDYESELLSGFYAFVAARPDAIFIHWGMRKDTFGLLLFVHRARLLGVESVEVRRWDLAAFLKAEYGSDFAPDPRLWHTIHRNGLQGPGLLCEEDARIAWAEGAYSRLLPNTSARVHAIAGLYRKARMKTFQKGGAFDPPPAVPPPPPKPSPAAIKAKRLPPIRTDHADEHCRRELEALARWIYPLTAASNRAHGWFGSRNALTGKATGLLRNHARKGVWRWLEKRMREFVRLRSHAELRSRCLLLLEMLDIAADYPSPTDHKTDRKALARPFLDGIKPAKERIDQWKYDLQQYEPKIYPARQFFNPEQLQYVVTETMKHTNRLGGPGRPDPPSSPTADDVRFYLDDVIK